MLQIKGIRIFLFNDNREVVEKDPTSTSFQTDYVRSVPDRNTLINLRNLSTILKLFLNQLVNLYHTSNSPSD